MRPLLGLRSRLPSHMLSDRRATGVSLRDELGLRPQTRHADQFYQKERGPVTQSCRVGLPSRPRETCRPWGFSDLIAYADDMHVAPCSWVLDFPAPIAGAP